MSSNWSSSLVMAGYSSAASWAESASSNSLASEMSSTRSAERCSSLRKGLSLRLMLFVSATVACALVESFQNSGASILASSSSS